MSRWANLAQTILDDTRGQLRALRSRAAVCRVADMAAVRLGAPVEPPHATLISPEYRALQQVMHAEKRYGKSGGKWWMRVAEMFREHGCKTWLDYGCGTGKLASNIRKLKLPVVITEYDPGVPEKAEPPRGRFDLVTCIDTLEHIELDCYPAVLEHLNAVTGKVLFAVISTRPAGKVLPDGRNAHLLVRPSSWWLRQMRHLGKFVVERSWSERADELCALARPLP